MKQLTRETIFKHHSGDGSKDWPPESALEYIAWFQQKLNDIPEEYRDTAIIETDILDGYEMEQYISVEISYTRPETYDEQAYRLVEEKIEADRIKKRELLELERLREKYNK